MSAPPIAPLIVGYVGQRINWNLGFVLAGVGMVFGLIQYMLGTRHLGDAGLIRSGPKPRKRSPASIA